MSPKKRERASLEERIDELGDLARDALGSLPPEDRVVVENTVDRTIAALKKRLTQRRVDETERLRKVLVTDQAANSLDCLALAERLYVRGVRVVKGNAR